MSLWSKAARTEAARRAAMQFIYQSNLLVKTIHETKSSYQSLHPTGQNPRVLKLTPHGSNQLVSSTCIEATGLFYGSNQLVYSTGQPCDVPPWTAFGFGPRAAARPTGQTNWSILQGCRQTPSPSDADHTTTRQPGRPNDHEATRPTTRPRGNHAMPCRVRHNSHQLEDNQAS